MIQPPSALPSVQRARSPIMLAFTYHKFGQISMFPKQMPNNCPTPTLKDKKLRLSWLGYLPHMLYRLSP